MCNVEGVATDGMTAGALDCGEIPTGEFGGGGAMIALVVSALASGTVLVHMNAVTTSVDTAFCRTVTFEFI